MVVDVETNWENNSYKMVNLYDTNPPIPQEISFSSAYPNPFNPSTTIDINIPEAITVRELANRMAEKTADVVKTLIKMGVMANATQSLEADTAEIVATTATIIAPTVAIVAPAMTVAE